MRIQTKLTVLVGLLFIAAIGNCILIFNLERHAEQKLAWVMHTYDVINQTEAFLSDLRDAETGQRGYLLTLNSIYLEPFHQGITSAKSNFKKLKRLTRDNKNQQKRLIGIEKNMALKLKELSRTVELASSGKVEDSIKEVQRNHGKFYMDNIRKDIRAFIGKERLLLEVRNGDYRAYKTFTHTLIFVELAFFASLAFMTFYFMSKSLFNPLAKLLANTHKVERGKKLEISDLVAGDEIGYLLSRFYIMNEIVHKRTEKLAFEAVHDQLTGLKNRSTLWELIQEAIDNTAHQKSKAALLYVDLDRFKWLNDKYGHAAGDLVLKEVAYRLSTISHENKDIFRIGGDEFVVILRSLPSTEQIEMIARELIQKFISAIDIDKEQIKQEISIGISVIPDDSIAAKEALKMADVAMYNTKKQQGSSYCFFKKSMFGRKEDKAAL